MDSCRIYMADCRQIFCHQINLSQYINYVNNFSLFFAYDIRLSIQKLPFIWNYSKFVVNFGELFCSQHSPDAEKRWQRNKTLRFEAIAFWKYSKTSNWKSYGIESTEARTKLQKLRINVPCSIRRKYSLSERWRLWQSKWNFNFIKTIPSLRSRTFRISAGFLRVFYLNRH